MAFKANRNRIGMGDWIGVTSVWDDPRAVLPRNTTDGRPISSIVEFVPADNSPSTFTVSKNTTDTRPASVAQLKFLKDLFAQRSNNLTARAIRIGALSVYKDGRLSITAASDFIREVKRIPRDT